MNIAGERAAAVPTAAAAEAVEAAEVLVAVDVRLSTAASALTYLGIVETIPALTALDT